MNGMNIHGLKCDNPNCDYVDETIKFEDYPSYVNAPCPKCGESLLTEADYETALKLVGLFGMMHLLHDSDENEEQVKLSFDFDGSGVPKIKISEVEK